MWCDVLRCVCCFVCGVCCDVAFRLCVGLVWSLLVVVACWCGVAFRFCSLVVVMFEFVLLWL